MIQQIKLLNSKITLTDRPQHSQQLLLALDQTFPYTPFNHQFGPPCLGVITACLNSLSLLLRQAETQKKQLFCLSRAQIQAPQNAVLLLSSYQVIVKKESAQTVLSQFSQADLRFYRDSSIVENNHSGITVKDCLKAVQIAKRNDWINLTPRQYYMRLNLKHGGYSQIVPNRILALSDPSLNKMFKIQQCVSLLASHSVKAILRLNNTKYPTQPFQSAGIVVLDLPFADGGVPSKDKLKKALIAFKKYGSIAVHCKAGLGRTGTMVAAFLTSQFELSVDEAVAWVRICRPGSIMENQHEFLRENESWLRTFNIDKR